MVSAINALSLGYYTTLANNSAYNIMSITNTHNNLLSSPTMKNVNFGSLQTLSTLDSYYEIEMITNSLQYKIAQSIIKQLETQQKENANNFNAFA